jgi:penicillin amidase
MSARTASRGSSIVGLIVASGLALSAQGARAADALCTANVGAPPRSCPNDPATGAAPTPSILRDAYGVPHIRGKTLYEAAWAIGWVSAQDRLVQLELTRRSATGNVAELFGTDQLEGDIETRRQFYSDAERQYFFTTLSCRLQTVFRGYADGINAYVEKIFSDPDLAEVPHEFFFFPTAIRALGNGSIPSGVDYQIVKHGSSEVYRPGPWKVTDSIAVTELLAGRFGNGGGRQIRQAALLQYLTAARHAAGASDPDAEARAIFDDVRWTDDPAAPTTIPATGANNSPLAPRRRPLVPAAGGTKPISRVAAATPRGKKPQTAVAAATAKTSPSSSATRAPSPAQRSLVAGLSPATLRRGISAAERMERVAEARNRDFGVFTHSGSKMWMIAPRRTDSGRAILYGGPQEGFDNPNIDVEFYVQAPGLQVGGMGIPGVPGVLIGETARFAWTTTSGEIDNSVLYVETLQAPVAPDPQTADAQYQISFQGRSVAMDRRTELFHFAGEDSTAAPAYRPDGKAAKNDPPLLYNVFRVNDCDPLHFHGYVMEFDLTASPARAFTYKSAFWKNETATAEGFLGLDFATDLSSFQDSVAKIVSLHNFGFVDQNGNIAYWSAGARPNFPPDYDDRLPADGTGSAEWAPFSDGRLYVPFSDDLVSINPTQGFLVNWNTKPAERSYIREGNSHDEHWGRIYRSERISFLIASSTHLSFDDAARIEFDAGTADNSEDTVRPAAPFLIPYLRKAYDALRARGSDLVDPATHPTLEPTLEVLEAWNASLADVRRIYPPGEGFHYGRSYSPSIGQSGLSIFYQWWYAVKSNLFAGGARAGEPFLGAVNFSDASLGAGDFLGETTYNMALHILDGAAASVPQRFGGDYFAGHRDEILVESLNDAISFLSGTDPLQRLSYGLCNGGDVQTPGFGTPDPAAWPWQSPPNLDFDCLDSFADPLLASGTIPTSFGRAVEQNRSTYMQVVEARNPIRGVNVLAPGQSGFIRHRSDGRGEASAHVGDQADLFRTFTYKPMRLFFPSPD